MPTFIISLSLTLFASKGLTFVHQENVLDEVWLSISQSIKSLQVHREFSRLPLPAPANTNESCQQTLQFFSVSGRTTSKALSIIRQFKHDPRLAPLGICILPPIRLSEQLLRCEFDSRVGRTYCDFSKLKDWLGESAISHLVVVTEESKAYTYQGIMYLDKNDVYSVFVHELAHFAGFMDEYALSDASASQHCEPVVGVNLASPEQVKTKQGNAKLWLAVGLDFETSESRTCVEVGRVSLKPSTSLTFMEYHDTNYIPALYIQLWKHQINQAYQYNLMRKRLNLPILPLPTPHDAL